MKWLGFGLIGLAAGLALFAFVGWLVAGHEEDKLDDGDPNNPYNRERRWWR